MFFLFHKDLKFNLHTTLYSALVVKETDSSLADQFHSEEINEMSPWTLEAVYIVL